MFSTIRFRLSITYLIMILLIMVLSGFLINHSITETYLNNTKINYLSQANILANLISGNISKGELPERATIRNFGDQIQSRAILLNENGRVLMDSYETDEFKDRIFRHKEVQSALNGEGMASIYYLEEDGWAMYIVVPVIMYREVKGAVFLSTSIESVIQEIQSLRWMFIIIFIIIGIVVTILSLILARYLTDPLKTLTEAAKKMARGNLKTRVGITGKDEIGQLGAAFNKMGVELEKYDKRQKSFVANASHELRTPLSSIKVLVESLLNDKSSDIKLYKEFLKDINSEINRLSKLVTDLLDLARMDGINKLGKRMTIMDDLIDKLILRIKPLAKEKNIELIIKHKVNRSVYIDPEKIYQMMWNLLENSIKYTPVEGKIMLNIRNSQKHLIIRVSDNGIGIPDESIETIFEPFVRVDKTRSRDLGGFGLGLPLVKEIVELHNGQIKLNSKLGKGTIFRVILPV